MQTFLVSLFVFLLQNVQMSCSFIRTNGFSCSAPVTDYAFMGWKGHPECWIPLFSVPCLYVLLTHAGFIWSANYWNGILSFCTDNEAKDRQQPVRQRIPGFLTSHWFWQVGWQTLLFLWLNAYRYYVNMLLTVPLWFPAFIPLACFPFITSHRIISWPFHCHIKILLGKNRGFKNIHECHRCQINDFF